MCCRWPGSRRRVVLADKNTALEELVVDNRPELYQYEVWNFSASNGRYIAYAVGQFECTEIEGPEHARWTHVKWTYSFHPTKTGSLPVIRQYLTSFVHGEYHAFMTNGLAAIREAATALRADRGWLELPDSVWLPEPEASALAGLAPGV